MKTHFVFVFVLALLLTLGGSALADGPTPNKGPMLPTSEFANRKPVAPNGAEVVVPGCYDRYEPNDNRYQVYGIVLGDALTHRFCAPNDLDYMFLAGLGEGTYEFRTTDLGPDTDTVIELYDYYGRLAMDDDGGGGFSSRLVWHSPGRGSAFFLVVRQYNPDRFGPQTAYTVHWNLLSSNPNPGPVLDILTIDRGCGAGYGIGAPMLITMQAGGTGFYTLRLAGPQGNRVIWSGYMNSGAVRQIPARVGWPEGSRTLTLSTGLTSVTCTFYARYGLPVALQDGPDSQLNNDETTETEMVEDM